MAETAVLVRFRPSGREAYVLPGSGLVEAAACAGIVLDAPCGGQGLCGKCRVRISPGDAGAAVGQEKGQPAGGPEGPSRPAAAGSDRLSDEEFRVCAGWRLACQTAVIGPMEVEIPAAGQTLASTAASSAGGPHQILIDAPAAARPAAEPTVRKQYVELSPPVRGDDLPDAIRLERALGEGPLEIGLAMLRELPAALREADFRGTAVLVGADHGGADMPVCQETDRQPARDESRRHRAGRGRLLDFERGNTESDGFAAAFDLGTTTLVGVLLDLRTGEQRAATSRLNPQTRFGDDVLSRILHASQRGDGLAEMHATIVTAIDEMIGELCQLSGTARHRLYELALAGNTTMQQVFCGVDPSALGLSPFVPAAGAGMACLARELGLGIHPRGGAYVMPVVGGFVGGDTVAGILATGLAEREGPCLLIDVGTNGEIVLLADGQLSAASTAAGPAFEGARISCGMRGSTGAIEKVVFDFPSPTGTAAGSDLPSPTGTAAGSDLPSPTGRGATSDLPSPAGRGAGGEGRVRINVIGGVPPVGLCGSGLIDVVAELLRHGMLTPQGRLLVEHGPRPAVGASPRSQGSGARFQASAIQGQGAGAERVIHHSSFIIHHSPEIALTQRDIREVQLATGAIRAGTEILLHRAGLRPADLRQVLVGGGFGNFIRRSNAQRIGLLPHDVAHHRIRYMGNTALGGARLAALSAAARQQAERLARRTQHVDLSADPAFHRAFAEAMIFPED